MAKHKRQNDTSESGTLNRTLYTKNPTYLVLYFLGTALLAWWIIYPQPADLIRCLSAFFPPVAVIIYWLDRRASPTDTDTMQADLSAIQIALAVPILTLFLAQMNVAVTDYAPLWIYALVIGMIAMLFAYVAKLFRFQPYRHIIWGILLLCLIYGFGLSVFFDTYFDNSTGRRYATKVISKHTSHGTRGTTFYRLRVEAWVKGNGNSLRVSPDLYDQTNIDDTVHINTKPGKLGAEWYFVSQ
jgi:hypothetical protein